MHHVSGIRGLKVGEPSATTWPRKKNEEPGRNAGRLPSYEVSRLKRRKGERSLEREREREREGSAVPPFAVILSH